MRPPRRDLQRTGVSSGRVLGAGAHLEPAGQTGLLFGECPEQWASVGCRMAGRRLPCAVPVGCRVSAFQASGLL